MPRTPSLRNVVWIWPNISRGVLAEPVVLSCFRCSMISNGVRTATENASTHGPKISVLHESPESELSVFSTWGRCGLAWWFAVSLAGSVLAELRSHL